MRTSRRHAGRLALDFLHNRWMTDGSGVHNKIDGTVSGPVVQAHTIHGGVTVGSTRAWTVPRQLPAAPRLFAGRKEEVGILTAASNDTKGMLWTLEGAGGVGKTWLALTWSHEHIERFPDGQLFVDLGGFTPDGEPMSPERAVRGFLVGLGVEPSAVPMDLEAQVGLYRSLVADRRLLVLLDNVRDTSHVAPLLPGAPTCTVIVTSRRHLPGLVAAHGARPLKLEVFSDDDAHRMLADRLGPGRLVTEPDATAQLLEYCAGLPLALSIVAARVAAHPEFPLSLLAQELHDQATRLDGMDAGELPLNLRVVFSSSYRALSTGAATLVGLLGLAPGPDISFDAARSLAGLPLSRVRTVLRELETAHLLAQPASGRYRLHDLIRLYVAERVRHDQPAAIDSALRRLIDFYLHTAYAGDRLFAPGQRAITLYPPCAGSCPIAFTDSTAAWAWFDTEHECVLAVRQLAHEYGCYDQVWQLARTLTNFYYRRGRLLDQLANWTAALTAAVRLADPTGQIVAHRLLGRAYARLGQHAAAIHHLQQALDRAGQAGDPAEQARTHRALASAWGRQGENQQALDEARHGWRAGQLAGDPALVADALNATGWFLGQLGRYDEARDQCLAALTLAGRHSDRDAQAATLDTLGHLSYRLGDHQRAADYHQRSATLYRALGHRYLEANVLDHLSQAYAALGHHDTAHDVRRQVLQLFLEQHRVEDADRIQRQLDDERA